MENINKISKTLNDWDLQVLNDANFKEELLKHIKWSLDEAQNSLCKLYKRQLLHLKYLLSSMDFIQPSFYSKVHK